MAALGTRNLVAKKGLDSADITVRAPVFAGQTGVNIIVGPVGIATIASWGVSRPIVGLPIMRDGFVTETGFLASPIDEQTTVFVSPQN